MKKHLVKIISFILSLVLIYFLLKSVDLEVFFNRIKQINPIYYLLAFLVYIIEYFVRAYRVKLFFPKESLSKFSMFICLQQFLNRVLPLRLGEIFFPILLKKFLKIEYNEGLAKLLITRIMDIMSVFFAFISLSLILSSYDQSLIWLSSTVLILLFLAIPLLPIIVKKIAGLIKNTENEKGNKIKLFIEKLAVSFSISKKTYYSVFILSVIDKFLNYIVAYFLIVGLDFDISLSQIISANTLSGITEILPINSIGSFGTTELGWAGALMYLDVPKNIAIESGFSYNLLSFSFTFMLGIVGLVIMLTYYKINPFKKEWTQNDK